jgi:hypothetical protein
MGFNKPLNPKQKKNLNKLLDITSLYKLYHINSIKNKLKLKKQRYKTHSIVNQKFSNINKFKKYHSSHRF